MGCRRHLCQSGFQERGEVVYAAALFAERHHAPIFARQKSDRGNPHPQPRRRAIFTRKANQFHVALCGASSSCFKNNPVAMKYFLLLFISVQVAAQVTTKNKKAIALYKRAENFRVRGQFDLAICVGSAPLAFLIGAGGLGELIFTGMALDDLPMMLAGAIPTALIAVLLDFLIGQAQYHLVPRGIDPLHPY